MNTQTLPHLGGRLKIAPKNNGSTLLSSITLGVFGKTFDIVFIFQPKSLGTYQPRIHVRF
jgi:hypothetical protein